jgi:hypothetical protein
MNLQIPLRWAALLVNPLFANDAMHYLRAEHGSSPCETGIMEIGLTNMYVQDAVSTTSENSRLSNKPWVMVSDHYYILVFNFMTEYIYIGIQAMSPNHPTSRLLLQVQNLNIR